MLGDALDQRGEGDIGEEQLVAGIVDDEGDVRGRKTRVDGVADAAAARDAVIELNMPITVPGQRADAVGVMNPKTGERAGKPA